MFVKFFILKMFFIYFLNLYIRSKNVLFNFLNFQFFYIFLNLKIIIYFVKPDKILFFLKMVKQ